MGDLYGPLIRLLILFPVVGVLAYASVRFGLGRYLPSRLEGHMRVLDRIALGPRMYLLVVKVHDSYFLISAGEKGATLVKEMEDYPQPVEHTGLRWWSLPRRPGGDRQPAAGEQHVKK